MLHLDTAPSGVKVNLSLSLINFGVGVLNLGVGVFVICLVAEWGDTVREFVSNGGSKTRPNVKNRALQQNT